MEVTVGEFVTPDFSFFFFYYLLFFSFFDIPYLIWTQIPNTDLDQIANTNDSTLNGKLPNLKHPLRSTIVTVRSWPSHALARSMCCFTFWYYKIFIYWQTCCYFQHLPYLYLYITHKNDHILFHLSSSSTCLNLLIGPNDHLHKTWPLVISYQTQSLNQIYVPNDHINSEYQVVYLRKLHLTQTRIEHFITMPT